MVDVKKFIVHSVWWFLLTILVLTALPNIYTAALELQSMPAASAGSLLGAAAGIFIWYYVTKKIRDWVYKKLTTRKK